MLIRRLRLTNLLSFGPTGTELELGPLNVLIGPNGAGKSNLVDAISLLRAAPTRLTAPFHESGALVADWLWKDSGSAPTAVLEAIVDYPAGDMPLRYRLAFTVAALRFKVADERIESSEPLPGHDRPSFYFGYEQGEAMLNVHGERRGLRREDVHPELSILSQRKDPDQFPELTYLGDALASIRIYRDWSLGRYTPPRLPQRADLPNDELLEDLSNLGLVINRLRRDPAVKATVLTKLQTLYDGIDDLDVQVEGGTVQVFFQEGRRTIPGTRLSDGTLRFLCLLALLCHPRPPPLLCIEEPELGLHPDILPTVAELLMEASERTQLLVTTHSDVLVDALTAHPDTVVVCEKGEEGTTLRRLDGEQLGVWLEKYSLGTLWTRGDLGGTRW